MITLLTCLFSLFIRRGSDPSFRVKSGTDHVLPCVFSLSVRPGSTSCFVLRWPIEPLMIFQIEARNWSRLGWRSPPESGSTIRAELLAVLPRGLLQPRFAPLCQVRCAQKRLRSALLHESNMRRPILWSDDLHQGPIAKDTGRPSAVIRFRMLHAISASDS
jgi:hypothetical protein